LQTEAFFILHSVSEGGSEGLGWVSVKRYPESSGTISQATTVAVLLLFRVATVAAMGYSRALVGAVDGGVLQSTLEIGPADGPFSTIAALWMVVASAISQVVSLFVV